LTARGEGVVIATAAYMSPEQSGSRRLPFCLRFKIAFRKGLFGFELMSPA
jgi:hypothetical protein